MSTHLATSLLRFYLVGLLAAARLLCPCVAVETAEAAQPQHRSEHSCCDESTSQDTPGHHGSDRHGTGHPHENGCQHCPDTPQIVSATAEGGGEVVTWASQPTTTPDLIRSAVTTLASSKPLPRPAAHPPQTLAFLRTVVLLV